MNPPKPYNPNNTLVLGSITSAYVALVCGLKLDGYTDMPWTLLLAVVWFPIASILACAALIVLCAGIMQFLAYIARKWWGGL